MNPIPDKIEIFIAFCKMLCEVLQILATVLTTITIITTAYRVPTQKCTRQLLELLQRGCRNNEAVRK